MRTSPPTLVGILGRNGVAVDKDHVVVAITYLPRLVRIPINPDGSAGVPEVLVPASSFLSAGVYGLDGIALDVHGNVYAAAIAPRVIARISREGKEISRAAGAAEGVTGAPFGLAFGTGKGHREALFVTIGPMFGGVDDALARVPVGVPGMPVP